MTFPVVTGQPESLLARARVSRGSRGVSDERCKWPNTLSCGLATGLEFNSVGSAWTFFIAIERAEGLLMEFLQTMPAVRLFCVSPKISAQGSGRLPVVGVEVG